MPVPSLRHMPAILAQHGSLVGGSPMPHKGHYTQGLAILLRNAVPLRAIEEQLEDFKVVKRIEAFKTLENEWTGTSRCIQA
jgi:hypothetical protein